MFLALSHGQLDCEFMGNSVQVLVFASSCRKQIFSPQKQLEARNADMNLVRSSSFCVHACVISPQYYNWSTLRRGPSCSYVTNHHYPEGCDIYVL